MPFVRTPSPGVVYVMSASPNAFQCLRVDEGCPRSLLESCILTSKLSIATFLPTALVWHASDVNTLQRFRVASCL